MRRVPAQLIKAKRINWLLVLLVVAAACGEAPGAPSPSAASVTGVRLGQQVLTLARNATTQLAAHAVLSDGTERVVTSLATWGSSDPSVATTAQGAITAVGLGTARVFVVYEGRSAAVEITTRRNVRIAGEVRLAGVGGAGVLAGLESVRRHAFHRARWDRRIRMAQSQAGVRPSEDALHRESSARWGERARRW